MDGEENRAVVPDTMRAIRLLLSILAQHPTARIDRGQLGPCGASRHSPNTPPCVVVSLGG